MAAHPHFLWSDLFKRNKSTRQLLEVLKENVLFQTLSNQELRYLASHVYERVYQPEEPVFKQNDRGLGMYILARGRIAIRTSTPEGEIQVTTLQEGSFFGEIALVEPENIRTASAIALERTVVIGFFKPDLLEILERKPAMGVKILFQLSTVLGRRLLETTERITQIKRNQAPTSTEKPHGRKQSA